MRCPDAGLAHARAAPTPGAIPGCAGGRLSWARRGPSDANDRPTLTGVSAFSLGRTDSPGVNVLVHRSIAMNTPRRDASNEEPELGAEESIPLDGKDPVGEQMMKELGRDSGKRADSERRRSGATARAVSGQLTRPPILAEPPRRPANPRQRRKPERRARHEPIAPHPAAPTSRSGWGWPCWSLRPSFSSHSSTGTGCGLRSSAASRTRPSVSSGPPTCM